jgi:hypothetical protein
LSSNYKIVIPSPSRMLKNRRFLVNSLLGDLQNEFVG